MKDLRRISAASGESIADLVWQAVDRPFSYSVEQQGVQKVFCFDRHFAEQGFVSLP